MVSAPQRNGVSGEGIAERPYYSISQAAAVLGVSRISIWRWINSGQLPVARLGHRTARISRDDLERIVTQRMTTSRRASEHDWSHIRATDHVGQFYEVDTVLMDAVGQFIGAALRGGHAGIVVATAAHRPEIDARVRASCADFDQACSDDRFISVDARQALAEFMVDGQPDNARFAATIGPLLDRAAVGGRGVRVFGEMVAVLASEGNHAGAIELEALWNTLQRERAFSLFCAYPLEYFSGDHLAPTLDRVAGAHTRIIPCESYTALRDSDERLREILSLQQKAQSLEAEVAQRRAAEERLRIALAAEQSARESAEAGLDLRDEFVSIASHELKTPLTTLSGYAQLMLRRFKRDGQLDPERVMQALQAITQQADKLSRLLGHLLDISRLEEGKLALELQPTDVVALLEQIVAGASGWSEQHQIALIAPPALEAHVDGLRLEQVLVNLLDNAVKYSPDGGPVEVVLSRKRSALEISVRDHGLGIEPARRDQIFERFYQAHMSGYRSGLGLGLFISRQIVELHGGQIRAEFPRGDGTRFVVRLPLRSPARQRVRGAGSQLAAD